MAGETARETFLQRLGRERVIAILRSPDAGRVVDAARVLYDAGIRGIEVTLTTAGALEAIADVRSALPEDAWVGAGTVMTAADVRVVAEAGAAFAVSPVLDDGAVAAAGRLGLPFVPGALTPTDIVLAWRSGPAAVKVSPVAAVGGAAYLRQVGAFLPGIPLLPTGGVEPGEVPDHLAAGAVGVGVSGPLLGETLRPGGDLTGLADRAAALVRSLPPAGATSGAGVGGVAVEAAR
ncbi:MAG: bifunctional 4-hydroxy-2-oxoglutarate aldolase/2-dehydro-3-deoxy-phosphogluconate aldolase [Kineosporiaceae bacterium]